VIPMSVTTGFAVGQQCTDLTLSTVIGAGNVIASIQAGTSITLTSNTGHASSGATDSIYCEPVATLTVATSAAVPVSTVVTFLPNASSLSMSSALVDLGDASVYGNLNVGGIGTFTGRTLIIQDNTTFNPVLSFRSGNGAQLAAVSANAANEIAISASSIAHNGVGTLIFQTNTGTIEALAGAATDIPFTVKGATSQSAVLQTWLTSTGGVEGTVDVAGNEILAGTIKTGGYAVSALPSGAVGMRSYVTDQTTSCPSAGGALTGGGGVTCPVFYNGSGWVGD